MIGLVLVTHGRLAAEFRAALEHVVGPQRQLETIAIAPDDNIEERRKEIIDAVQKVDSGAGVAAIAVVEAAARIAIASAVDLGSMCGPFLECRHDARRRHVGKAWLVGDAEHLRALTSAQRMRRRGSTRLRPSPATKPACAFQR